MEKYTREQIKKMRDKMKYLIEYDTSKTREDNQLITGDKVVSLLPPVLEGIFDNIAKAIEGKSDKGKLVSQMFAKHGIKLNVPIYMFRYEGGSGKDGSNDGWFNLQRSDDAFLKMIVPQPKGYDKSITPKNNALQALTITDMDTASATPTVTTKIQRYNFKTGKDDPKKGWETVREAEKYELSDPQWEEKMDKELGSRNPDEKLYVNGVEKVKYADSLWKRKSDIAVGMNEEVVTEAAIPTLQDELERAKKILNSIDPMGADAHQRNWWEKTVDDLEKKIKGSA